jgi:hypothetical protein
MSTIELLKKQSLPRVLMASLMAVERMVVKRCCSYAAFAKENAEMVIMVALSIIAIAICL